MKRSPKLRKVSSNLSDSVHQRLNMYAVAASAARVGILALAQNAEAKIVYTPAHVKIGVNSTVPLDLNHDGVSDFSFKNNSYTTTSGKVHVDLLTVIPAGPALGGNKIWGTSKGSASALSAGAVIRKDTHFRGGLHYMAEAVSRPSSQRCSRAWANAKNRYLGLRFTVKGKIHFGWARLSVACDINFRHANAILTGYAYETIPNKAIIAGKTKGRDEESNVEPLNLATITVPAPEPAMLGLLAMGAPGLSIWRRDELASTNSEQSL
jgi:hypothetical protein